ncbi:MAG: aminodeoxychorismate synthase component I [Alistipes inops]
MFLRCRACPGLMNAAVRRRPFLFAVNFKMTEGLFAENPLACSSVGFSVNRSRQQRAWREGGSGAACWRRGRWSSPNMPAVSEQCRGLLRGDSFLANLTVRTPVVSGLSLEEIFMRAEAPYLLYVPGRFVCFSPERFVRIAGGRIATNPMKGTINASVPDARQTILNDPKETAEHNTVVDLLRNDLSIHADRVHVERFRYIDRIATRRGDILQVSSEIAGRLPAGYEARMGDILFDMLPAGSVSGAPKSSTLRIIREAEGEPRGYYTGVFGFDGQTLDSAVLIRFIEEEQGRMYFRSGGGITAYSDCRSEYEEVIEKVYLPFV